MIFGALGATLSVAFGLLLKTQEEYSGSLITIHQWSGIATAILAAATVTLHVYIVRQNKKSLLKSYRAVLIFTVLNVTVAGHYGAALTHGADFLTSAFPGTGGNPDFDVAQFTKGDAGKTMNENQIAALNLEVRSIFAHNCYKCHSSEK